jgi:uncharacterized protein (TIGR04255 family)
MFDRHYEHAPIVEAIIDVKVEFSGQPDGTAFATYGQKWAGQLPQHADLTTFQVGIGPPAVAGTAPNIITTQGSGLGFRLSSPSNDRALMVQAQGLTYSHLPPYTRWEDFFKEFADLWSSYVDIIKPSAVTRVALRYINQIAVPHDRFELSDFFAIFPEIPKTMPQDITGLFMQLQMPQPDLGPDVMAIINFGSGARNSKGQNTFLLDFDVFANRRLDPNSVKLLELLAAIRLAKNQLFENCITDKTRELIR